MAKQAGTRAWVGASQRFLLFAIGIRRHPLFTPVYTQVLTAQSQTNAVHPLGAGHLV
jgi:hypothetical protein